MAALCTRIRPDGNSRGKHRARRVFGGRRDQSGLRPQEPSGNHHPRLGNRIIAENQQRMFAKLLQHNVGFFADRSEFMARLTTGAAAASQALNLLITSFGRDLLSLVGLVAVMAVQDPVPSALSIIVVPPAMLLLRKMIRRIKTIAHHQFTGSARILETLQEMLQGIRSRCGRVGRRDLPVPPPREAEGAGFPPVGCAADSGSQISLGRCGPRSSAAVMPSFPVSDCKGRKVLVRDGLDDLDRLRPMGGFEPGTPLPTKWGAMREGDGRTLWERCLRTRK
jgi:ABC transporter transmembrane region